MNASVPQGERSQPVIVCAAVRLKLGIVVCGPRHFDMTMRKMIDQLRLTVKGAEQGFVDQFGTFYGRQDAYNIARNAGQPRRDCGGWATGMNALYSEDLY